MFKIYGTDNCKYCILAKNLLKRENISFEFINISNKVSEILDKYSNITKNQRTIPLIFYDTSFIGGYVELSEYIKF